MVRDVLLARSTIIELRHPVTLLAGLAEVQCADQCSAFQQVPGGAPRLHPSASVGEVSSVADQAFNSLRQVEEVVMVQVKQIQEMGAYVKLASLSLSNVATDQAGRAKP